MTDDDRPPTCSKHDWHPPVPRLGENREGDLVPHQTELMEFCMRCVAERTVEREPK